MVAARERLEAEVQLRTRELVESNRQLEEAARAKSDFLDRMSHELRTPMNGVVGMTELLDADDPVGDAVASHEDDSLVGANPACRSSTTCSISRRSAPARSLSRELPIDLAQVLEECTSMFAGAADNKGIELIVCPPPPSQRALLGDPLRLRQVLMNLVGNAVKFTERGEVVVRADVESAEGDRAIVRLAVTDTGIGMDAPRLDRSSSRSRRPTRRRRAASAARAWALRFAASWPTSWMAASPSRVSPASVPRFGCRCRSRSAP